MNFSIAGNAMQSSVTLELRYDSLNVAWMKNENGRLQERKFLSAVLDGLALKHSNPDSQGMRTGSGTTERDQYRSQFNYLWKSLATGSQIHAHGARQEAAPRQITPCPGPLIPNF